MAGRSPHGVDLWNWGELAAVALAEARCVLRGGHDSEDAAQEAIMRAFRARGRCLTPEAPGPWVRTIARREALRILARRTPEPNGAADALDSAVEDISELVLNRLVGGEFLVQIPPAERSLLVRRYLLEHSSAEIAADLRLPPSTVRVRLHRALSRFREHHSPGV